VTNHPNRSLRNMTAIPTYRNTKLMPWWEMLNAEMAKRGLDQVNFGDARGAYEVGESPETAAAYFAGMDRA